MKTVLGLALLLAASPALAARPRVPSPKDLSVEELVGQVFMIAIDTEIAVARRDDIEAGRVGGALLRWDRFTGPQARAFAAEMGVWSRESPHRIPMWLSTDHEGGPLFTQRLYGAAPFPGNMALGAARSPSLAYRAAKETARELRALGLSVTFAPVLDVNTNPADPVIGLRSFGDDPARVARLGVAALNGYRDGGLLAVPKHFPGHGDAAVDSHLGLPVNLKPLSALDATELVPFRAAFKAGARAVMPAHMVFPALGTARDQPVTLSSAALRGFLRGRMDFHGLIFSDSLDMGAIADVHGSSEAAVLALEAGNDVLLLGKADFPSAFAAVVAAVRSGRVPRARLERSVARILREKERLGLFRPERVPPESAETRERGRALARRVAERAVTLVKNDGLLPLRLKPGRTLAAILVHSRRFDAEARRFAAQLERRHSRVETVDLPEVSPSEAQVAEALSRARGAAAIVVGTYRYGAADAPGQKRLLDAIAASGTPWAAVSLMNPYDLDLSTGADAQVCAYGMTDSALDAAARLLFGEIRPRGRLPVSVPGVAPRGAGLRGYARARKPLKPQPTP
jgi:beta-N-acetylhexosaminidase